MKGLPSLVVVCALSAMSGGRTAHAATERTTEGRLVAVRDDKTVDAPLEHTDVQIRIDGPIADTTVTQRFKNPYAARSEAVYLFPLPAGAAVTELRIATGTRTITGAIQDRAKARQVYEQARGRGQIAALLAQARPDLFVQAVANVEPAATVEVTLRYVQRLEAESGSYEVVFPGARRSSHELALRIELDAGVPITSIESPSHPLAVTRDGRRATIRLATGDAAPDRDFVLRYGVGGVGPEFGVLVHRDGGTGSFLLIAQPPVVAAPAVIAPRELVFVLDTSSSMRGAPLEQAKRLILKLLLSLRPDDTFQIVRLDDRASALGPAPIANRPNNIALTLRWLSALEAGGTTDTATGIAAALALPHDPARLRVVAVLTDGHVGNEDDVLANAAALLGDARLFCLGVGSAVNRYLLDELAALGRGAVQVVRPDQDAAAAIAAFQRRIDAPVATDLRIDWGDLAVRDVPRAIPDLFAGQPIVVAGHYDRAQAGTAHVHGKLGGRDVRFDVPIALPERDAARPAIASLWARQRIAELSRRLARKAAPALAREVLALALEHHLPSPYTAFVAVDDSRPTGPAGERAVVPVEVPPFIGDIALRGSSGFYEISAYPHPLGAAASAPYGPPRISRPLFGPHIAIPPTVSLSPRVAFTGTLDRATLRRHVRRRLDAIRYCYEKALIARPGLRGTVTAHFTVSASGHVVGASATGLDRAVEACIVQVIESIEFPAVPDGTPTAVNYPFTLVPSELSPETAPEVSP